MRVILIVIVRGRVPPGPLEAVADIAHTSRIEWARVQRAQPLSRWVCHRAHNSADVGTEHRYCRDDNESGHAHKAQCQVAITRSMPRMEGP
jgi:hypothetical protein